MSQIQDLSSFENIDHEIEHTEIQIEEEIDNSNNDQELAVDEEEQETTEIGEKELVELFYSHSPPWGGKIASLDYLDYNLVNTCSFDYLLYAIWLSSKLSNKVIYFYICLNSYVFNNFFFY
jgi:hypothetical protein